MKLTRQDVVQILEIVDNFLDRHGDQESGELQTSTPLIEEIYSYLNDRYQ